MRFWLSRHSEVPIRDQLVTQIVLGILSNDLQPGQRLPSTRELARRFRIHANTVSAAYKQLEQERWVELRHGSGIYVHRSKPRTPDSMPVALDQLVAGLFGSLGTAGAALPMNNGQVSLPRPDLLFRLLGEHSANLGNVAEIVSSPGGQMLA